MRKSTVHMFFLLCNCSPSHYFQTLLQTLMTILFSPIHRHIMRCTVSRICIDISMNDSKIVCKEVIKCFQLFTTVSSINNQLYTILYSLKIWVRIKCQDRVRRWSERTEGMEREQREVNRKLRLMTLTQGTVTLARTVFCCTINITTVLFSSVYFTNTTIWVPFQLIILYIIITWGETLRMHLFFQIQ